MHRQSVRAIPFFGRNKSGMFERLSEFLRTTGIRLNSVTMAKNLLYRF